MSAVARTEFLQEEAPRCGDQEQWRSPSDAALGWRDQGQQAAPEQLFHATPEAVGAESLDAVQSRQGRDRTTESVQDLGVKVAPVVWLERGTIPQGRFELLQKWEGAVLRVEDASFVARLCDLTTPDASDEEATFEIDEISDGDLELLQPGAVFYLSVGYSISLAGQKERSAQFRFRRLPAWSRAAMKRIEARSNEAQEVLARFE